MTTPRMRTAEGALAVIKTEDPETAVTLRAIRGLINTGKVPHVPVGKKKLVDVDQLMRMMMEWSKLFPSCVPPGPQKTI